MNQTLIPVILSGGSGTRLWPLSQPERPKQLLPLVTSRSLLQDTLLRTEGIGDRVGEPIVICNTSHRFLVAEQLREIDVQAHAIVLEPEGRNTAPAVAVAALLAMQQAEAGDDPILLILPADHVIADGAQFAAAVGAAVEAAHAGKLVTFGVVPTSPETGYGYIRQGASYGGWSDVAEFVEKPDAETARSYLSSGEYSWNSGMFLFSAKAYLAELSQHYPDMPKHCLEALENNVEDSDFLRLGASFLECESESIDYAVMEKTKEAAVVPLDAGWNDVGSWSALHDVLEKDSDGNVLRGKVFADDCRDCYVSAESRVVAILGVEGCVVVETDTAVLVMPSEKAQGLKALVEIVKSGQ